MGSTLTRQSLPARLVSCVPQTKPRSLQQAKSSYAVETKHTFSPFANCSLVILSDQQWRPAVVQAQVCSIGTCSCVRTPQPWLCRGECVATWCHYTLQQAFRQLSENGNVELQYSRVLQPMAAALTVTTTRQLSANVHVRTQRPLWPLRVACHRCR